MSDFDAEEREILEAFDADQLKPVADKDAERKKHREYAAATFKKDQRINIRISSRDLQALKKRALVEGIPYQMTPDLIDRAWANMFVREETIVH